MLTLFPLIPPGRMKWLCVSWSFKLGALLATKSGLSLMKQAILESWRRRCQFLSNSCLISLHWLLYCVMILTPPSRDFCLGCIRWERLLPLAHSKALEITFLGYPLSLKRVVSSLDAFWKSHGSVQLRFSLRNCPLGIPVFKWLGWKLEKWSKLLVAVFFLYRSVDTFPSLNLIFRSRKLTCSLDKSAVSLMWRPFWFSCPRNSSHFSRGPKNSGVFCLLCHPCWKSIPRP